MKSLDQYREEVLAISIDGDFKKLKNIAAEYLKIATAMESSKHIAYANFYIGRASFFRADYPNAINCFEKAASGFIPLEIKLGLQSSLIGLATTYSELGKKEVSIKYLQDAKQVDIDNLENKATILNNLGSLYFSLDDLTNAQKNFLEGIDLLDADNTATRGLYRQLLTNLAEVLILKKQYKKALNYISTIEVLTKRNNFPHGLARILMKKIRCHGLMKEYAKSKLAYKECVSIATQNNYTMEKAMATAEWSVYAIEEKDFEDLEDLLIEEYEAIKDISKSGLESILKQLIAYYTSIDNVEKQMEYRTKLYAIT